MSSRRPRILLYSHDTYGLGHIRRTLLIAGRLAQALPKASQLLVTGSMVAGAFDLPPHLDLIKLPALSKRGNGQYTARALPLSLNQVMAWREQMLLQAAIAFEPDLVLVDKTPAGVRGELLPTLRHLKTWRPHTRLVLGMRDIEDDAATTQAEWAAGDIRRLHEEVYDSLLLYGQRDFFDPVAEYGMSLTSADKIVSCGYLGDRVPVHSPEEIRRMLGAGDRPLVVVTAGGGGDGFEIFKTYLEALPHSDTLRGAHSVLVTGPLMARGKRELLHHAAGDPNLTLIEFTPDLVSYLAAADLAISMAGYNTVCEILAQGTRSLLVPRTRPRTEQLLRAERLAARGLARMLHPDELSPSRLIAEVESALGWTPRCPAFALDGLDRTTAALAELLGVPEIARATRI